MKNSIKILSILSLILSSATYHCSDDNNSQLSEMQHSLQDIDHDLDDNRENRAAQETAYLVSDVDHDPECATNRKTQEGVIATYAINHINACLQELKKMSAQDQVKNMFKYSVDVQLAFLNTQRAADVDENISNYAEIVQAGYLSIFHETIGAQIFSGREYSDWVRCMFLLNIPRQKALSYIDIDTVIDGIKGKVFNNIELLFLQKISQEQIALFLNKFSEEVQLEYLKTLTPKIARIHLPTCNQTVQEEYTVWSSQNKTADTDESSGAAAPAKAGTDTNTE